MKMIKVFTALYCRIAKNISLWQCKIFECIQLTRLMLCRASRGDEIWVWYRANISESSKTFDIGYPIIPVNIHIYPKLSDSLYGYVD